MPGSALGPELIPGIPALSSAPLGIPGFRIFEYHKSEIAGVGSSQYKRIPYVRVLRLRFQNQTIYLQDVDICDKLYGQPAEIEALLGYDFLENRDWLLEQAFRFLP